MLRKKSKTKSTRNCSKKRNKELKKKIRKLSKRPKQN